MLNEKATIILFSTGLIKNTCNKVWNWPKSKRLRGNVKVELGLSNYATKSDLKKAPGIDLSELMWQA